MHFISMNSLIFLKLITYSCNGFWYVSYKKHIFKILCYISVKTCFSGCCTFLYEVLFSLFMMYREQINVSP